MPCASPHVEIEFCFVVLSFANTTNWKMPELVVSMGWEIIMNSLKFNVSVNKRILYLFMLNNSLTSS